MEPSKLKFDFASLVPLFCGYDRVVQNDSTSKDDFGFISYEKSDTNDNRVSQLVLSIEFSIIPNAIVSDWCDQMNIDINKFVKIYNTIEHELSKQCH